MGVLSLVAGVMLTLAVPGLDTTENGAIAQAAVVTQQNDVAPVATDDTKAILLVIRFHDCATSDNKPYAISQAAADGTDLTS